MSPEPGCKNENQCQGTAEEMEGQGRQEPSREDRLKISQVQDWWGLRIRTSVQDPRSESLGYEVRVCLLPPRQVGCSD